ncbi:MAG: TIM barrel protein [Armatimonadetes bacterium]|nr:TIM barrel protein [Armatimonadota bacterium]
MSRVLRPVAVDAYVGWSVFGPEEFCAAVFAAGFEGFNLPFISRFKGGGGPVDVDLIERLAGEHGLCVPSVYVGGPEWSASPPCLEHREGLEAALAAAQRLGAKLAGTWPGVASKDASEEMRQRANLCDCLRTYLGRIADAGLRLSLEFEPGSVVGSFESALALSDDFHGAIGLCLDTHHVNNLGVPPTEAVERLGARLAEVHLSSTARGPAGEEADQYDYAALFAALAALGYEGPLTSQFPLKDPAQIPASAAFALAWRDRTWS